MITEAVAKATNFCNSLNISIILVSLFTAHADAFFR
jgi:hypothetical protein